MPGNYNRINKIHPKIPGGGHHSPEKSQLTSPQAPRTWQLVSCNSVQRWHEDAPYYRCTPFHTSIRDNPMTITAVSHEIALNQCELVYFPIKSVLLIRISMKIITIGSRTPFRTCDRMITFTSGKLGISTTAAPSPISDV